MNEKKRFLVVVKCIVSAVSEEEAKAVIYNELWATPADDVLEISAEEMDNNHETT